MNQNEHAALTLIFIINKSCGHYRAEIQLPSLSAPIS